MGQQQSGRVNAFACSRQGTRPEMEDAHAMLAELPVNQAWSYYAVFDGHNGRGAADYCVQHLAKNIDECLTATLVTSAAGAAGSGLQQGSAAGKSPISGGGSGGGGGGGGGGSGSGGGGAGGAGSASKGKVPQSRTRAGAGATTADLTHALKVAFVKTDATLLGYDSRGEEEDDGPEKLEALKEMNQAGTTSVVVLVDREARRIAVAHAGDSRAVWGRPNGYAEQLTADHKPDAPGEKRRILAAGRKVVNGRLDEVLGVSRSIGLAWFKEHELGLPLHRRALIPLPDVRTLTLPSRAVAAIEAMGKVSLPGQPQHPSQSAAQQQQQQALLEILQLKSQQQQLQQQAALAGSAGASSSSSGAGGVTPAGAGTTPAGTPSAAGVPGTAGPAGTPATAGNPSRPSRTPSPALPADGTDPLASGVSGSELKHHTDDATTSLLSAAAAIAAASAAANAASSHATSASAAGAAASTTALLRQQNVHMLILACDGVWDVLSSQEAVDYVNALFRAHVAQCARAVRAYLKKMGVTPQTVGPRIWAQLGVSADDSHTVTSASFAVTRPSPPLPSSGAAAGAAAGGVAGSAGSSGGKSGSHLAVPGADTECVKQSNSRSPSPLPFAASDLNEAKGASGRASPAPSPLLARNGSSGQVAGGASSNGHGNSIAASGSGSGAGLVAPKAMHAGSPASAGHASLHPSRSESNLTDASHRQDRERKGGAVPTSLSAHATSGSSSSFNAGGDPDDAFAIIPEEGWEQALVDGLCDEALRRGSRDNVTGLLVLLEDQQPATRSAVKALAKAKLKEAKALVRQEASGSLGLSGALDADIDPLVAAALMGSDPAAFLGAERESGPTVVAVSGESSSLTHVSSKSNAEEIRNLNRNAVSLPPKPSSGGGGVGAGSSSAAAAGAQSSGGLFGRGAPGGSKRGGLFGLFAPPVYEERAGQGDDDASKAGDVARASGPGPQVGGEGTPSKGPGVLKRLFSGTAKK